MEFRFFFLLTSESTQELLPIVFRYSVTIEGRLDAGSGRTLTSSGPARQRPYSGVSAQLLFSSGDFPEDETLDAEW